MMQIKILSDVHRAHLTSACGSDFAPRFEFDSICEELSVKTHFGHFCPK